MINIETDLPVLVSVIVPIYNVEDYLERCVDSILRQSYEFIEVLLIDDGSTDESGNIADGFSNIDSRIRVFHKENGGLSDSRNYGLIRSSGEYVCFIDADDYIHANYISCLLDICIIHSCEIAQCNFVKTSGEVPNNGQSDSIELLDSVQMLNRLYGENYLNTVVVWNKLYKKHLFDKIVFPENRIHEDEATTYKLIYQANRIGVTKNVLYYYYQRSNSIMQEKYSLKRLDILWAISQRKEFFLSKGYIDLYYNDCYKYLMKVLKNYQEIIRTKEIKSKHKVLIKLRFNYFEVLLESKGANWKKKRWLMLVVFGFFPRLFTPVMRIKLKYIK